jgi:hypothetical protein
VAKCKSCGAEIIWAINENGKRVPLDAKNFIPKGLFTLEAEGRDYDKPPRAVAVGTKPLGLIYQTHYATCPDADQWRRK